jgi:hypothetical protein
MIHSLSLSLLSRKPSVITFFLFMFHIRQCSTGTLLTGQHTRSRPDANQPVVLTPAVEMLTSHSACSAASQHFRNTRSDRASPEHVTASFGLGASCLSACFEGRFVHTSDIHHKCLGWDVHVARMRQKKYVLVYCRKTVRYDTS